MRRSVRPGKRVLFLDEVGTWKGVGTAWYLAGKEARPKHRYTGYCGARAT